MGALLAVSRAIDRATAFLGRAVMWLILASILVSAGNAVSRKLFAISSNAWLELQWYLFGAAYFIAASYTLQRNEHIRIDIFTNMMSKRLRNWIDLIGHFVMLMPFVGLMIYELWPFARNSFLSQEMSSNYGGLIIWPAKAIILAGFVLLFFQGISEIIKRIAIMRGLIADEHEAVGHSHPTADLSGDSEMEAGR